jgi:hypothetical protein
LRTFSDLADVSTQAHKWLEEVANKRRHRETGQAPEERFQPETLWPLPVLLPDYRDTTEAFVHKDLRLSFDGNRYCVPPRYVRLEQARVFLSTVVIFLPAFRA